jgi:ATP-dependent protease HslVU (ClpYQ) peptidase subunit
LTCIVALVDNGSVTMAADSVASTTDWRRERLDNKMFFNGEYLIGVCGSYRAMQIIHHLIDFPEWPFKNSAPENLPENSASENLPRNSASENLPRKSAWGRELKAISEKQNAPLEKSSSVYGTQTPPFSINAIQGFFVKEIVPLIQSAFDINSYDPNVEDSDFSMLMAVQDIIVEIENDFQVGIYKDFAAVGSGIHYAIGSLHTTQTMSLPGRERLKIALDSASTYVPSVGGTCYVGSTSAGSSKDIDIL